MSDSVKSIKTYKSPITGRTYTKIVYKGTPGLQAAKVTAEKPEELKKKEEEEDKKKKTPFLPGPAGSSLKHGRRVEKGGKL